MRRRRNRRLADWGEVGFLRWIGASGAPRTPGLPLRVGIGDDAAVIETGRTRLLVSTDALVEGVHFRRDRASASDIGWKAAAVNLSDIAAMGGRPHHLFLSIAAPPALPSEWLRRLTRGFRVAAARHGAALAGGDTCASPGPVWIGVTVIGTSARPVLRSGARVGDGVYVTRTLGDSAAGLISLEQKLRHPALVRRHLRPDAEVAVAAWLAARRIPSAMIDLSDGLSRDLHNLCRASRCGTTVDAERLPISAALRRFCRETGGDPLELALHGGEDYGLLFTAPRWKERHLSRGRRFHRIGVITRRQILLVQGGRTRPLDDEAWEHFR